MGHLMINDMRIWRPILPGPSCPMNKILRISLALRHINQKAEKTHEVIKLRISRLQGYII